MMKVGSDTVTLTTKERNNISTKNGKKSSNRKNIKQDLAALTGGEPSGWCKVYDGNALEYVSIISLMIAPQVFVGQNNVLSSYKASPGFDEEFLLVTRRLFESHYTTCLCDWQVQHCGLIA